MALAILDLEENSEDAVRAKQEAIYRALRFLNDATPKDVPERQRVIRDFSNEMCRHDLLHDGQCSDCGLQVYDKGLAHAR